MGERRVVIGAEAAAGSLAALAWALAECRDRNADLLLVHAIGASDGPDQEARYAAGRAELEMHRDAAARVAPDVVVSMELVEAAPDDALVAASEHADLVVLGSRGRKDLTTSALGSVAHRTAVHARCPVAIVRAETAPSRRDHDRRVVVGVADAPAARAALQVAAEEAVRKGATLHLVSCPPEDAPTATAPDRLAEVREDLLVRHPELRVTVTVANAEPVVALLEAAQEADLVVLGCHHSEDHWSSRIGGVAAGVLGRAACPVVLVGTSSRARHKHASASYVG